MSLATHVPNFFCVLTFLLVAFLSPEGRAADSKYLVFVGTYTGKGSKGIYAYRFDSLPGELKPAGLAAETEIHPSWRLIPKVGSSTP